jgi:hypothetical protein
MADGVVNTALSERFRTSVSGETFTISNATKPDGTSWAGPTITNVSGTLYSLAFTPTLEGIYLATITGNTSGEVFSGAWDITAEAATVSTRRIRPITDFIEVVQGDSYLDADGRALVWSDTDWSDLTGATVTLTIVSGATTLTIPGTIGGAGQATQAVTAELTAAQTAQLRPGRKGGVYNLSAALSSGGTETLAEGDVRVMGDFP